MRKNLLMVLCLASAWLAAAAPAVLYEDRLDSGLSQAGAPVNWTRYKTTIDGQDGTISVISPDGRKAVKLADPGPGEIGFYRQFKVTPGQFIRASIDAALPPGAKESDAFKLQLTFRQPKLSSTAIALTPTGTQFESFRNTLQVPEGATELFVYLYSHKPPTGEIVLSNFKLETDSKPFPPAASLSRRGGIVQAPDAAINPETAEVVEQANFGGGKGVSLKPGRESRTKEAGAAPDLVFDISKLAPGRYELITHAAIDARGQEEMKKASSKYLSMFAKYQIGDQRPTERVIFVPWARPESSVQTVGKFHITEQDDSIKVWLPAGLRLDYLQVRPYVAPAVPEAVQKYRPALTPPKTRPRLWVNAESLPQVRKNLEHPEHRPFWEKLRQTAAKPFVFEFDPAGEVKFDAALENAAADKAFYYLMTGDKKIGREAIQLTIDYLSRVEFGNILDITREIGRAIYSAARVYDWCYELMSKEERELIRKNLMRLSDDMEIGWPPFKQSIVNGHGNEAQVNRDLLSMAIAIYDEDPVPYQYCSYMILEQLVPMRAFEYQSSRHNQGVGYGSYRFTWDMHAAWLFRRMLGKPVFDDNIETVYKFWQYMRTPSGEMLRDGDGITGQGRYWTSPLLTLLCYAYNADPVIKGEFFYRQNGAAFYDPQLFLLLNDPELPSDNSLSSLPLSHDFGPILGSLIARTGWNIGRNSPDVVAEIKGGGYHFGNHQHADAGSFQIYYRGLLAAKLGIYHYYGTPYDMNFNKRSISQPMLLVRDPAETFLNTPSNDGGSRFVQSHPRSPEEAKTNPMFNYGKVRSADFGPSKMSPCYSYFSVDLVGAYSPKITDYVRSFCFLNLGLPEHPAAILIFDDVTSSDASFRKYWQINTLKEPELTDAGAILRSNAGGLTGKLHLNMVKPAPADRTAEVFSGKEANSVFGLYYTPPKDLPEANGHRIMFSPTEASRHNRFFVVMQIVDGQAAALPELTGETEDHAFAVIADRVVYLAKGTEFIDRGFAVQVPAGREKYQVLVTGLKPGDWNLAGGGLKYNVQVAAGRNTVFFTAPAGEYRIAPGKLKGAAELLPDEKLVPPAPPKPEGDSVIIDGKVIGKPAVRWSPEGPLLPAREVLKALGVESSDRNGMLTVNYEERKAVFQNASKEFTIDGAKFTMTQAAVKDKEGWFLPDQVLALLSGRDAIRDNVSRSVAFQKNNRTRNPDILWVESNTNPDQDKLMEMLSLSDKKSGYWDGEGKDTWIKIVFTRPQKLRGVGIAFMSGSSRQAKFSIEVSEDGSKWTRVFDGESSGATDEIEEFLFPQTYKVSQLRFNGYGNTLNNWNSIVTFKMLK